MMILILILISITTASLLVIYTVFFLLVVINNKINQYDLKNNQRHLTCDINPRCHPAFFLTKDNEAWIGNFKLKDGTY